MKRDGKITWLCLCAVLALLLAVGTLLYNGLIASALAFLLWNYILTHMEAGSASIAVIGVPAVGVLSGVVVLHEPMSWPIAFGMALVFIGIFAVLGFGAGKKDNTDSNQSGV